MNWEPLYGLEGMTFQGESFRTEELEKDNLTFEWHGDILTYADFWEVEMMYVFNDPEDELFENISSTEDIYYCGLTGQTVFPVIDSKKDETHVAAYIPVDMNLEHEIGEFPLQYLDQLRDEFYQQVISHNTKNLNNIL